MKTIEERTICEERRPSGRRKRQRKGVKNKEEGPKKNGGLNNAEQNKGEETLNVQKRELERLRMKLKEPEIGLQPLHASALDDLRHPQDQELLPARHGIDPDRQLLKLIITQVLRQV